MLITRSAIDVVDGLLYTLPGLWFINKRGRPAFMKISKASLFILMSFVSQILGALIVGLAITPSFFLVYGVWKRVSRFPSIFLAGILICLTLGLAYFIFINCLLILIVLLRHLLGLRNQEAEKSVFSRAGLRLGIFNWLISIAKHIALPLIRTTPIIVWFYRGMGAKIGKNTIISTIRLWDCDLIEIGRNSVIGGNVAIAGHLTTPLGSGILKKVKIGNRVTIGADSVIYPGVVIEDNVVVAPGSMVPMDSHLERRSIYAGIPVKKIR